VDGPGEVIVLPSRRQDSDSPPGSIEVGIHKVRGQDAACQSDTLAIEEPLEIRLSFEENSTRVHRPVSVTMRTPGHDPELAIGFLWTEGILSAPDQIGAIHSRGNVVCVELQPGVSVDLARIERHFYTSSSCGVCGKASIDALRLARRPRLLPGKPVLEAHVIHQLPDILRERQQVFDQTGGLHAAGLFDANSTLLCLREDVGRHNAVDKLVGSQLLAGKLPLAEHVLLVSGRVSFELVQKALMAGIPIIAAIGAPSSLAVELARRHGMTILGFLRQGSFNIYSSPERVRAGSLADSVVSARYSLQLVSLPPSLPPNPSRARSAAE
jgi:FdhD protein